MAEADNGGGKVSVSLLFHLTLHFFFRLLNNNFFRSIIEILWNLSSPIYNNRSNKDTNKKKEEGPAPNLGKLPKENLVTDNDYEPENEYGY